MGLRVKDRGGSEGRRVRDRIGAARSPRAKASRLPRSVSGREPSANRRRGQCRTVGGNVTILAGAASATDQLGSPHCRSNAQVDPKANGADRVLTEGALSEA